MAMLEVRDLEVYYGVIQAIKGISFDVDQGEIVALIGANIGIDLAGIRMKGCCQRYSCGIGAAAAQCRVILIAVHTLETGHNDDLAAGQLMKDSLFINLL